MQQRQTTRNNVPPVTIVLIVLCAAAYLILPHVFNQYFINTELALSASALEEGRWWTLITSMFLHGGLTHILCNMFSLYYLGILCEAVYGKARYLILYFASGIAGGLAFAGVNALLGNYTAFAVGASGAIFGLFGAYGWILFAERRRQAILVRAVNKDDVIGFFTILAVNLFIGFAPGSNIANEAHIGGMIAGFVLGAVFYMGLPRVRRARQMRRDNTTR